MILECIGVLGFLGLICYYNKDKKVYSTIEESMYWDAYDNGIKDGKYGREEDLDFHYNARVKYSIYRFYYDYRLGYVRGYKTSNRPDIDIELGAMDFKNK